MDELLTVLRVIVPLFFAIFLGICARKKGVLSADEIQGMQRFIVKFCIPCLIFRSCLTADITAQALSSMALLPPFLLISVSWAFRARRKTLPYFNLPHLFACKETGMMGIPLFMILFGADQAYRMGILDLAQAVIAYPVLAILSAGPGADTSPKSVVKQMLTSPLIILSVLGLVLNLSGLWSAAEAFGVDGILLETLSFLSEPISAVMLFCVGYNFTLTKDSRAVVFKVTAIHIAVFAVIGLIVQALLFVVPNVDTLTRWAMLMYCILPASYLAPGLGRNQEDFSMASGVCSITTMVSLAVFCCMAVITA